MARVVGRWKVLGEEVEGWAEVGITADGAGDEA